jgi:fatty-acyl-CoA synthase
MHLFALLTRTARSHPHAEAFISRQGRCTFAQLHEDALALAACLHQAGIRPGMRTALACGSGLPFVHTVFALLRLGAVCVPLNWRLTPAELKLQIEHAGASYLLYDQEPYEESLTAPPELRALHISVDLKKVPASAALPPPPRSADPACIIYTAGTIDSPRGVVLSHGNLLANSANYCAACDFTPGQRELAATQLFHISTFSRLFTYVRSATACFLMQRFSPDECFDIIQREKITSITQTPTMYRMLLRSSPELRRAGRNLRRIITGASRMSPTERQDLQEMFPAADLYDIYGQTEAGPGISVLGPQDFFHKAESVGKPMPGVQVAIVDEKGCRLAANTIGEITCRGRNIMQGYLHNEEATRAVLIRDRLHTGDMGYMDEEGFVYIVGRKKDIIITGGMNVYPPEIENVLLQHPGVEDCAVFGVPDELWGEAIIAAVVLGTATVDQIHAHCRTHLAAFKCPKLILPVPDIPRNPAGKVIKSKLLVLWESRFPQSVP